MAIWNWRLSYIRDKKPLLTTAGFHLGILSLGVLIVLLVHREIYGYLEHHPQMRMDLLSLKKSVKPVWASQNEAYHNGEEMVFEGKISALEDDLMEKVTRVLEQNPWIRRVVVAKKRYPNLVTVVVERRIPLLAVEVCKRYILVDREGMVLPGTYNQIPLEVRSQTKRVTGVSGPAPVPNQVWRHDGIKTAVEVAQIIERYPTLSRLGIEKIDVSNVRGRMDCRKSEVVLCTANKVDLHWGRTASFQRFGEIAVEEKIKNLEAILKIYPRLSGLKYAKLYIQESPTVVESTAHIGVK